MVVEYEIALWHLLTVCVMVGVSATVHRVIHLFACPIFDPPYFTAQARPRETIVCTGSFFIRSSSCPSEQ